MRRPDALAARLLALAWTALWFGGFAVSIWRAAGRKWDAEPVAVESVRMTQLPPAPSSEVAPGQPPLATGAAPAQAPRRPAVRPGTRPGAAVADSVRMGDSSGTPGRAPAPGGVAPAAAGSCSGPCATRGGAAPAGSGPLATQEERDAALWNYTRGALADAIRRGPPARTQAERDSMAREESAKRTADAAAGRSGQPAIGGGVTLGVGLPGGGPSAAERARNRRLDAEVRATLERIRTRADSVRWARCDSLAKRDPRAAARDTLCTVAPR